MRLRPGLRLRAKVEPEAKDGIETETEAEAEARERAAHTSNEEVQIAKDIFLPLGLIIWVDHNPPPSLRELFFIVISLVHGGLAIRGLGCDAKCD